MVMVRAQRGGRKWCEVSPSHARFTPRSFLCHARQMEAKVVFFQDHNSGAQPCFFSVGRGLARAWKMSI